MGKAFSYVTIIASITIITMMSRYARKHMLGSAGLGYIQCSWKQSTLVVLNILRTQSHSVAIVHSSFCNRNKPVRSTVSVSNKCDMHTLQVLLVSIRADVYMHQQYYTG